MCSRYNIDNTNRNLFMASWAVQPPDDWTRSDIYPGYEAPFLRRPAHRDAGDETVPPIEAVLGRFGLLPWWTKDPKKVRSTYNARTETVATKNSFRDPWRRAQHCIIPADAIYEPDWRGGKCVPTRIARADGDQLGIAGLWERWKAPDGKPVHSFTMLTVNADDHDLMRNYHRPTDEKRMVVVLPKGLYDDWLDAPAERSMEFMRQFPHGELVATGEPPKDKQAKLTM